MERLLGLLIDRLDYLDIDIGHMEAIVGEDDAILHFSVFVQAEYGLADVSCRELVEGFEGEGSDFTSDLGSDG